MTREEAIHLLGVPDSASDQDIQKKYNELYNEYQIRLTNAPTPNLKKLYQKNLQELNEGVNFLLKGETAGILKDLPSSAPVFESGEQQQNTVTQPQTTYGAQNIATGAAKKNTSATQKAPSKGIYIFGLLSVILLAGVILLYIFMNEKQLRVTEQENTIGSLTSQSDSLATLLNRYTSKFANGNMQISNKGSKPLNVTWLIVSYMDESGNLVKIERWMDVNIRPGGSEKLQVVDGSKVTWDGSVVSYAFGILYEGRELIQAGIWSIDAVDGSLVLNFDN